MAERPILTSFSNGLLRIELNRPKAINSLNLSMVTTLWKVIREADRSEDIHAILLTGVGEKGFCAGGDVKSVVLNSSEILSYAEDFFQFEYLIDDYIFEMKKPVIALAHGITMGGGLGLFMSASHRVVTSNALLAMPETTIGFFPDVGASYFLNKVWKKPFSHWLALSGHHFSAADSVFIGCSQNIIRQEDYIQLIEEIKKTKWTESTSENHHLVTETLSDFNQSTTSELENLQTDLEEIFSHSDLSKILDSWKSKTQKHKQLEASFERLQKASPMATALTYRLLQNDWNRSEAAVRDWDLALQHCHGSDFQEGVRALLIDKDQKPIWQHSQMNQVKSSEIERFFSPIPNNPIANYFSATK